jgi:siroheme synthase
MAVGRLAAVTAELLRRRKYPPSTAVTIVENASLPSQRVLRGRLLDISRLAVSARIVAPATIVIGAVNSVLTD